MAELVMLGGLGVALFTAAACVAFGVFEAAALRFVAPKWAALIAGVLSVATVYGAGGLLLAIARIISIPREGEHKPTRRFWYGPVALCAAGALAGLVGYGLEEHRKTAVAQCRTTIGVEQLAGMYSVDCSHDGIPPLADPHRTDKSGAWFAVKNYGGDRKMLLAKELAGRPYEWQLMSDAEFKAWTAEPDEFGLVPVDPDFEPDPFAEFGGKADPARIRMQRNGVVKDVAPELLKTAHSKGWTVVPQPSK